MRYFRRIHIAVLTAVMGVVCVLTLSDTLVDPVTARAAASVDTIKLVLEGFFLPTSGGPSLSRSSVPFRTDTIGHFVAWSGVGFMAAGIPTTAINRLNLYFGLFAMSAFLEAGQRYLSWSRVAEFSDLVANGAGLAVGFVVFGLVEAMVIDRIFGLGRPGTGALRRT